MAINRNFLTILLKVLITISLVLGQTTASYAAAKVNTIQFKTTDAVSYVEIVSDSPISFEKKVNESDRQIVIELKDAVLGASASRKYDTSSFNSPVKLISPYRVGKSDTSRVVIQLRERAESEVVQEGNLIRVSIQNSTLNVTSSATSDTTKDPVVEETIKSEGSTDGTAVTDTTQAEDKGVVNQIETFLASSKSKKFIGKPIDLVVQDVDILAVLQTIGEASGFNVIVGSDVVGKVTLTLREAPWDQVLDLILTNFQLGAERNNNVLRVLTLAKLTAEKQAELAAKKAIEQNSPRITRVFPISYARLGDLSNVFAKFASTNGGPADASTLVQVDERTNSIIVRDTVENIDRIKKLIELLDTQTPQVLIEAKVVEATESGSNSIGGNFGFGFSKRSAMYFSANGGTFIDPLLATGSGSPAISGGSGGGGAFGLSPIIEGIFPGIDRINATLAIAESEDKARVLSSPRTVVLNKESANIVSGTPVLVKGSSVQNGISVPNETVQSANLSLNVTPTVTNDGNVLLDLSVSRDVPFGPGIATRTIKTKVVVDSGATLVIGGIYTTGRSDTSAGIPVLRDIPILGHFFGTRSSVDTRFELFIFINPRILNEKEAGLNG